MKKEEEEKTFGRQYHDCISIYNFYNCAISTIYSTMHGVIYPKHYKKSNESCTFVVFGQIGPH